MERKKNGQIKEMISMRMLVLFCTILMFVPNFKFKFLVAVVPEN